MTGATAATMLTKSVTRRRYKERMPTANKENDVSNLITVTAATGRYGRLVIDALSRRGVPASGIVAAVRDPEKAADLAAKGVQVRRADYDRPETLAPAFTGARRLLLTPSATFGQLGVAPIVDYRSADLNSLGDHFDVVYDTSGQLPVGVGLHLLKKSGVLLDIHFTPAKLLRSLVSWRLKLFNCAPSPKLLDGVSDAAAKCRLRISVGETAPLAEASRLIAELEAGRKINGKGLIAVQ